MPVATATAATSMSLQNNEMVEESHPLTVEEASEDSRRAARAEAAEESTDTAPEPTLVATGAWTEQWHQQFAEYRLAPKDIEYLASGGFSEAQLTEILNQLAQVALLDSTSTAPATASIAPASSTVSPASTGMSPEWKQKFSDLLKLMGFDSPQVAAQLATVDGQLVSEQQLQVAYDQMKQSLGAYDETWKAKFTVALAKVPGTDAQRTEMLQQIAGSGLDEATLQQQYQAVVDATPGWSNEFDQKFAQLELPDELVKQLRESQAPASALQQQYDKLLQTKKSFVDDGRFQKLVEAGATKDEQWMVMLQGTSGADFDKVVAQVHSSHVSLLQRAGSFALNLVPGMYALQYLWGSDWVTGEKIDRTNPLNIIGAVASGFAGFTAIRSAVAGVQGLVAANAAAQATKLAAGGAALADAVSGTSSLSTGAFKAIEAAGLVSKFDNGLKLADYVKSAIPLVNRFGEAGRLAAVGRGYFQGMQLAAGAAAIKTLADGTTVIDKATKATVLSQLKQGSSIQQALAAAGRGTIVDGVFTASKAGTFAIDAATVVSDTTKYGFLQGAVGKAGEGAKFMRGSGNFAFNPFKNTATISETATEGVFTLGRSVNFASRGGLAQGLGLLHGANSVATTELAAQAATRAAAANDYVKSSAGAKVAGVTLGNEAQRIETVTKTAEWAKTLGVTDGIPFRSLLQIGQSNRAATRIANMVQNGGRSSYAVTRTAANLGAGYGGYVASSFTFGALTGFGVSGATIQPWWDALKTRDADAIDPAEAAARKSAAQKEAERLREIYAKRQAESAAA